jgi:hypothetical protein
MSVTDRIRFDGLLRITGSIDPASGANANCSTWYCVPRYQSFSTGLSTELRAISASRLLPARWKANWLCSRAPKSTRSTTPAVASFSCTVSIPAPTPKR